MKENIIVYLGDLFAKAFSLEWVLVCALISVVSALLMRRASHTFVWAFLALLLHFVILSALPHIGVGVPDVAKIWAEMRSKFDGSEWMVLLVEYGLYAFLIVMFYLSKHDMFREWPPHGAAERT
jgi:hypothetical protein